MSASFEKLIRRNGAYSLPYLIHLYDEDHAIDLYYVNDVNDIEYDSQTYTAGAFSYTPNGAVHGFDGGGKLSIAIKDNGVVNLVENNTNVYLDVIGVLNEFGAVTELKKYTHHYGSVKISKTQADFTFAKDDRLSMTFPALIWNRTNNSGNA